MKNRKLTSTGDYSFGNNERDFIQDNEALAQAIKTRILLFYNEWWEDIEAGIPMFQNVLGQVNEKNISLALQSLLTKRIQEFSEVRNIKYESIDVNRKTRSISLSAVCELVSGSQVSVNISV